MIAELLCNIVPRSLDNVSLKTKCHDCGTVNHWEGWQIRPSVSGEDGATSAVCYACDARQYDILFSATDERWFLQACDTVRRPAPAVIAWNNSVTIRAGSSLLPSPVGQRTMEELADEGYNVDPENDED